MAQVKRTDAFEIRTVGLSTALHEDLYHRVLTMSWAAFFAFAGLGFALTNAFFAGLYLLQPGAITGAARGSFADAFFFSVQTMGTIGFGVFAPATTYAHVLVTLESLTGLLGFAIITGVTFAKFARPTARVVFSDKAVIGLRDGAPHLMFRIANARHNTIAEASLKVMLLVDTTTKEGERLRMPVRLPLVRDANPFFRLTWTAMHLVDEASPFFGEGAIERLRERNGLVLLTVSGLDETTSNTIHARRLYQLDEIVDGARFEDMLGIDDKGVRVIDYAKMNSVLPEQRPPS